MFRFKSYRKRFITLMAMMVSLLVLAELAAAERVMADENIQKQYLPIDSDGDGILDERDECYKTPAGIRVDKRGCTDRTIAFETIDLKIHFDFDSVVVKPEYFSEVKKVADFMRQHPLTRVTLEAHTDSDGAAQYNQLLSQRRAQSVAKVLVTQFRIKPLRITAKGYGEEQPLVDNDSEAHKAKNRRVVAVIKVLSQNFNKPPL